MNNKFISRYNAGDTHFDRTDQFTGAKFEEDEGTILIYIAGSIIAFAVLGLLCLVATL